jgi:hypothetical protein
VEKYYDRIEIIQEIWRNFRLLKGTKVYHTNCSTNRDKSFSNNKTFPKRIPASHKKNQILAVKEAQNG